MAVSILGCGKYIIGKQKLKKCGVYLENSEYPILTVDQLCLWGKWEINLDK